MLSRPGFQGRDSIAEVGDGGAQRDGGSILARTFASGYDVLDRLVRAIGRYQLFRYRVFRAAVRRINTALVFRHCNG